MYKCEYCNSSFSRATILTKHQNTAKYCLELRGENHEHKEYTCNSCKKIYSRRDTYNKHVQMCTVKSHDYDREKQANNHLAEQILQLQKQITELMTSGTRTHPNINIHNHNLQPLTDENISEHIESLSIEFILQGAKGYATFANSYPFKNRVVCTDKSRKKLKYMDANGQIVDDPRGMQLTQRFFQTYAEKNRQIINNEYHNLQQQVQEIAESGNAENSDLTGILLKSSRLQEILQFCNEAAEGKDNEFTQEFISHLTKIL